MENNTAVTANAESSVEDRFEVETNIVSEPAPLEKVEPAKVEAAEEVDTDSEPFEEPTEQKSINPRTAQRKAQTERLKRELALEAEEKAALKEELRRIKEERTPVADAPKARDLSKKPDPNDYENVLDYLSDDQDYKLNQRIKQAEEAKQLEAYNERAETLRADKPDFNDRISELDQSGLVNEAIHRAVLRSSMNADIAYHLSQYSDDLMILRGLPVEALPKAIKDIEAFIKKGGAEQQKPKITKAEPPITPPGVTANADRPLSKFTQEEVENMPLSQFKASSKMKR